MQYTHDHLQSLKISELKAIAQEIGVDEDAVLDKRKKDCWIDAILYVQSISSEHCQPSSEHKARPISFGWTCDRLLKGLKTVTRRVWKDATVRLFTRYFNEGRLIPAFDKSAYAKGQKVAFLKLTEAPYLEQLANMPDTDTALEGFPELSKGQFIERFFGGDDSLQVCVVRFEVVMPAISGQPEVNPKSTRSQPKDDQALTELATLRLLISSDREFLESRRNKSLEICDRTPQEPIYHCNDFAIATLPRPPTRLPTARLLMPMTPLRSSS